MNPDVHLLDDLMLLQRLQDRLLAAQPDDNAQSLIAGIDVAQQAEIAPLLPLKRISAAVLVPLVQRGEGLTVLFTERSAHLKHHAGQISFPGGRIEGKDDGALQAAVRETEEEIGLSREHVHAIGYLPPHLVFTGYHVIPVVALVQPGFSLNIDANEVADVFEVPLKYVLNPAHHQARERQIGDVTARVYDLPYGERHIWGATAGILMNLYRLLSK
jgi:8-oxo-dGTP pyrophosphatase MutT (NUDIX family)